MTLTDSGLSQKEMSLRVNVLMSLGVPMENIKIHPDCQPHASSRVVAKRRIEWGFKTLGAFVGANEYVLDALNNKMKKTQKLTDVLTQYPKAQARHCLHRLCYDIWQRSFPSGLRSDRRACRRKLHRIYPQR